MFQKLGKVLRDRLKQQGVAEGVEAAQVTEIFRQEVKKRFGQTDANSFRQLVLRGDTLEVSAYSPALASSLRMAQLDLEEAIKQACHGKSYRLRIFS